MDEVLPVRAVGGRIVLDTFRSEYDPMLRSWLLFRAQILGEADPVRQFVPRSESGAAEQGVHGVWRVLATNNRELGRCATLHPSPLAALADAESVAAAAEALTPSPVRGAQPMTHGWVLRRDGIPALMTSRWYESASEANAAAKAARKALLTATIVHGVSMGTQSGRRQRRALVPVEPLV